MAAHIRQDSGYLESFQRFIRGNALTRRIDFDLFLVLSVPFILLAANNEWLFPYGNPTDAWINKKFFFDTGHEYPALYTTYKATRLSWIIKGYLVHQLLPPLAAHYVLHLTMFGAYLALFYLIVRHLMNRHVAVIGAIAFGTYSQLHAVISFEWDYQTHDGVVNMLLTLLFLLFAAKGTRWRLWLVLAGAAWASALQTTYMGTLIPAVVFWYLYLNHQHGRRPLLASALYVLAGAVAATLLYGLASLLLGGPFFFFMSLIEPMWVFGFSGLFNFHPGYWFSIGHLLQFGKGLVVPLYAIGISACVLAAILLKHRKSPVADALILVFVSLFLAFAASAAFHLIGHGQLSNDHMLAYLAPFVFLAIAGIYAYVLRVSGITVPAHVAEAAALKVAVLAMFCGALIFSMDIYPATGNLLQAVQAFLGVPVEYQSSEYRSWQAVSALTLLLLFMVVAAVLSGAFLWARRAQSYILALCFSGFLALANMQTASIAVASYDWRSDCGYRKDQYQAVIDAYLRLKEFDFDHNLRLWYRNNEIAAHPDSDCGKTNWASIYGKPTIKMTALYGGVLGMRGYTVIKDLYALLESYLSTYSFARLAVERPSQLPQAFRAAILARSPDEHQIALNTLRSNGFKTTILDRTRIRRGVIAFDMTILDVRKDDRLQAESRL